MNRTNKFDRLAKYKFTKLIPKKSNGINHSKNNFFLIEFIFYESWNRIWLVLVLLFKNL